MYLVSFTQLITFQEAAKAIQSGYCILERYVP